MQHQVAYRKLGRTTAHREALFRNMVVSLILRDRIETTLMKAKELRRVAERMVTLGKAGTLAARRLAAAMVQDPLALKKLFTSLAERFAARQGGYTRITRLGFRRGDCAPMAVIEYLDAASGAGSPDGEAPGASKSVKKARAAKKSVPARTKAATKKSPAKQAKKG